MRLEDLTGADAFVVECLSYRLHLRWPGRERLLLLCSQLRCRRCGVGGRGRLDRRFERAPPEGSDGA